MPNKEEAIVKRIIKCYLIHKGEASTSMISNHINQTDYGLRKEYSNRYISLMIKRWSDYSKSGEWFKLKFRVYKKERWWSLE